MGNGKSDRKRKLRLDRRAALKLGAAAVGGLVSRPSLSGQSGTQSRRQGRSERARDLRVEAARKQNSQTRPIGTANGDEERYPDLLASFAKGLPHASSGLVEVGAFRTLVRACESGDLSQLSRVPTPGPVLLVNPLGAWTFSLEGPDPHSLAIPPAPAFASAEQAAEACELYWQALARDVSFSDYDANPLIAQACKELSGLKAFTGPRVNGSVTPAVVFRGPTAGDLTGPYISQFLLKEVPYGAIRLVPHVRTATSGLDYLVTWDDWLHVQNGAATVSRHAGTYRYIRTARDLAAYVQLDFSYQAFLTACLILFGMEGTTDVRRPYKGAPYDAANPYRGSKTQSGFSTFGAAHVLDLVARVSNLALQHAWFHKWLVHRRLRPEEYGGRIHAHKTTGSRFPLHESILQTLGVERVFERQRTYLLPQAYPEGSPIHPSYPSGHATIAGACVTVLKAFFDESFPIEEPVAVRPDGLGLVPYAGPPLTVGGELDKLAFNLGMGRNAAGIHWRSDNAAGLRLGEAIAINLLRELRGCYTEPFAGFSLTQFDGSTVTV